jgi:hypothetical protein
MKCKQYTINAQYTISIDHPKKELKEEICTKVQGGLSESSPLRSENSQDSQAGRLPHTLKN